MLSIFQNIKNCIDKILTVMQRGGHALCKRRHKRQRCQNISSKCFAFNLGTQKFLGGKGAILIEFAASVSILIALLYYAHDVPKSARLHKKMEFCAYCMVNILQNISQNRENKRITKNDIRYAIAGAFSTVFPGNTMYTILPYTWPLGHVCNGQLYCVRGNSNGTASILWIIRFHMAYLSPSPDSIVIETVPHHSLVNSQSNIAPENIYRHLKIQNTEIKILVECGLYFQRKNSYLLANSKPTSGVFPKYVFGFYMLNPRDIGGGSFFNSVVIFTPKTGLFDANRP
jgi:hypothetical protein